MSEIQRPPPDRRAALVAVLALAVTHLACGQASTEALPPKKAPVAAKRPEPTAPGLSPAAVLDRAKPLFQPLPDVAESADNPITDAKVELGRLLYFDARLSKNHDVACNTCHDLAHYGVDVREHDGVRDKTSRGHKQQVGGRNSPTVYNAAFHLAQFWDGRAADVEEQAKGPILNPVEMASVDEASVIATIRSIPGYAEKFTAAFGEGDVITYDNVGKAIGAFERKLVTPGRFDQFLNGKITALAEPELRGLVLFLDVGCTTCHTGPAVGGAQFQKLGSVKPWPGLEDEGRKAITQAEADAFVFKVPSLRNVTETAPYLHDGSIASLAEIVVKMAEHQTARGKLSEQEVGDIVAFLGALKGDLPLELIAPPTLPESGPNTPPPDAS